MGVFEGIHGRPVDPVGTSTHGPNIGDAACYEHTRGGMESDRSGFSGKISGDRVRSHKTGLSRKPLSDDPRKSRAGSTVAGGEHDPRRADFNVRAGAPQQGIGILENLLKTSGFIRFIPCFGRQDAEPHETGEWASHRCTVPVGQGKPAILQTTF